MTNDRYCVICGCELCEDNELHPDHVQDLRLQEELYGTLHFNASELAVVEEDGCICQSCFNDSDAWFSK